MHDAAQLTERYFIVLIKLKGCTLYKSIEDSSGIKQNKWYQ